MSSGADFTKVAMSAVVSIILLCAVAIPIINAMPAATGENASIINSLVGIIPVVLAVAVIIAIVYSAILKKSE